MHIPAVGLQNVIKSITYERIKAQKFYQDYEKENFNALIIQLENTTTKILALVESKTNEALYHTPWYDKWTLGRMIQLNTASPFKNAKDRIRKWKKANQLV